MSVSKYPSLLPASFWRGGTSNGLLIHRRHLPESQKAWQPILTRAMGSPDPYGRQLNGMGGGISSLSKVCVIDKSKRDDADVDFSFVQVGIKDDVLDMAGNCGNMSSAVGPFALEEGVIQSPSISESDDGSKHATIRIFNTNTSKVIHSKFLVREENNLIRYQSQGSYSIDGVAGTASCVTLSFLNPGGSKTGSIFPSGRPVDTLVLSDGFSISASCVDIANPGVFIRRSDLQSQISGSNFANMEDDKALMDRLEEIRQAGARVMGLDPSVQSVPKIVMLAEPGPRHRADIICVALSMGKVHKAVPLTLALNLGVNANLPGTLAHQMRKVPNGQSKANGDVASKTTVCHPSGFLDVQADIQRDKVASVSLTRTARLLMKGEVNWN